MLKVKNGPQAKRAHYVVLALAFSVLAFEVLWPLYIGPIERQREMTCASNLKMLGLGLIQYEQDYDRKLPGGADHWAGQVYSYEKSKSVYICPDDSAARHGNDRIVSYAMNANLRGASNQALDSFEMTVMLIEFDSGATVDVTHPEQVSKYTLGEMPNRAWGGVRLGTTANVKNPPRHDPNLLVLSCDGHVLAYPPLQISSGANALSQNANQDATHAAGATMSPYQQTFSEK